MSQATQTSGTRQTKRKATKSGQDKVPHFKTDAEAEDFVSNADLTEYDLSGFRPMSEVLADTESKRKTKTITFRLSEDLLAMLKAEAKAQDVPYQRLMRRLLAKGLMR